MKVMTHLLAFPVLCGRTFRDYINQAMVTWKLYTIWNHFFIVQNARRFGPYSWMTIHPVTTRPHLKIKAANVGTAPDSPCTTPLLPPPFPTPFTLQSVTAIVVLPSPFLSWFSQCQSSIVHQQLLMVLPPPPLNPGRVETSWCDQGESTETGESEQMTLSCLFTWEIQSQKSGTLVVFFFSNFSHLSSPIRPHSPPARCARMRGKQTNHRQFSDWITV